MRKISTGTLVLLFTLLFTNFLLPATANAANKNFAEIAKEMMAEIHSATWLEEGKSSHLLYVFFDPNCPYCHKVYVNTREAVKHGDIRIRWIPVGVLTATSYGKALTILDSKDPLKAFYHDENNYSGENGGAAEEALDGSDKAQKALKENTKLLRLTGFDAVPSILFDTKDDQPYLIQGSPPADKLKIILQYVK